MRLRDCSDEVFRTIISLNFNRILGRVGSKHYQPSPHERYYCAGSIGKAFRECVLSPTTIPLSQRKSATFERLERDLDAFDTAFRELEKEGHENAILEMQSLIKATFDVTGDGYSLRKRLRSISCPIHLLDVKCVSDMEKVANYWRISESLCALSRGYRRTFTTIRLECLEPYKVIRSPGNGTERYVHAEIQLLVFYETSSLAYWPQAIESSKDGCFLCNSFLKAHGKFFMSKAHRRVFNQWTVPDRGDYSLQSLERIRHSLSVTVQDVEKEIQKAPKERFPLQSSINLHKPIIPTLSVTSCGTVQSSIDDQASQYGSTLRGRFAPPVQAVNAQHSNSLPLKKAKQPSTEGLPKPSGMASVPSTVVAHEPVVQGIPVSGSPPHEPLRVRRTESVGIAHGRNEEIQLDWLKAYVYLDPKPLPNAISRDISDRNFSNGNVSLQHSMMDELQHDCSVIDITNLPPGQDLIIGATSRKPNGPDADDEQLAFVLSDAGREPLKVCCRWLK